MKKMDYTIGFQGGRAGQKWTATALTDRAKERTPEPVMFAGRPEASKFLKDSQAEGYRFSGAELVDPEQRLVKNRLLRHRRRRTAYALRRGQWPARYGLGYRRCDARKG